MFNSNNSSSLDSIAADVVECRACPRLVSWREQVAHERRAAFADEEYWGRPITGFGDPSAGLVIVGLAPAAHGGNRTGRVFTGDRSGDWLFGALYRAGFANQPTSVSLDDGLRLQDCWVTAAVKCAPPANKPTVDERDCCTSKFLIPELTALTNARVVVCLGKFAYDVVSSVLGIRPRPAFGHGVEVSAPADALADADLDADGRAQLTVLCSFHPSQQNTFTKKLTEPMFDAIFARARVLTAEVAKP